VLGTPTVIPDVFAFLKHRVAGVLLVSVSEVEQAIRYAHTELQLRLEGAAGATLAAAQQLSHDEPVIALMTGANISDDVYATIINDVTTSVPAKKRGNCSNVVC
jgi:threonine dehydratase